VIPCIDEQVVFVKFWPDNLLVVVLAAAAHDPLAFRRRDQDRSLIVQASYGVRLEHVRVKWILGRKWGCCYNLMTRFCQLVSFLFAFAHLKTWKRSRMPKFLKQLKLNVIIFKLKHDSSTWWFSTIAVLGNNYLWLLYMQSYNDLK